MNQHRDSIRTVTPLNRSTTMHGPRRRAASSSWIATSARVVVLLLLPLSTAFLVACMPDIPAPKPKPIITLASTLDLSGSTGNAYRCRELGHRLHTELNLPGASRLDVLVLGTGWEESNYEPIVLLPWKRFERGNTLYEKVGAEAAERDAFVTDIVGECEKRYGSTNSSPIFPAIARGLQSLRARCQELERRGEHNQTNRWRSRFP